MNFNIRGARLTAGEVAQLLLNEYIDRDSLDSIGKRRFNEAESERYRAKMRLYRLALALLVLKAEEERSGAFEAVTVALQALVFPNRQSDGVPLLTPVEAAMRDLGALISLKAGGRQLYWAKDWLGHIGIEEFNPARLALFSMYWMDSFTTVTEMIREFFPERA